MEAVDVVEAAVPRLGDDGQRPLVMAQAVLAHVPLDHRVAHHAYRVRIGDRHRAPQKPRLLDPGRPRHLPVAVHREPRGEHGVGRVPAAGEDRGDARADGPLPHHEPAAARHQRAMPDLDAGDVGDGVEGAGGAFERDADVAGALATLRGGGRRPGHGERENEGRELHEAGRIPGGERGGKRAKHKILNRRRSGRALRGRARPRMRP